MSFMKSEEHIRQFYDYAIEQGFTEDLFFNEENQEFFEDTAIDAYRDYPLFPWIFSGKYDEKTLKKMLSVDFKSRLPVMAGITCSRDFESVMLLEPPEAKRTGMIQYLKAADAGAYTLLLKPAMYRLEEFEKFALEKRKPWINKKTWYLYVFATRKNCQGMGYGKKLMECLLSFAGKTKSRICLETNLSENAGLYRHFGFQTVDSSVYKDTLEHDVLVYPGNSLLLSKSNTLRHSPDTGM